jgi:hypothetical protein
MNRDRYCLAAGVVTQLEAKQFVIFQQRGPAVRGQAQRLALPGDFCDDKVDRLASVRTDGAAGLARDSVSLPVPADQTAGVVEVSSTK